MRVEVKGHTARFTGAFWWIVEVDGCQVGPYHMDREDADAIADFISNGFDDFVTGYIDAALWADCQWAEEDQDPSGESGGRVGLELRPGVRDTIIMRGQLEEFFASNAEDLIAYCEEIGPWTGNDDRGYVEMDPPEARAGHDFWLTRSRHGTGFWDRGLGELGDRLTEAAHGYGSPDDHIPYDCGDGTAEV